MVFDGNGYLFIGLGGVEHQRASAQDLDKLQGKVVRLTDEGKIPPDNPFVGKTGERAEIWSYGIRNPQGMAMNPWSDTLWLNEHGPRGGDEINIPEKGKNYGSRSDIGVLTTAVLKFRKQKVKLLLALSNPSFTGKSFTGSQWNGFYNSDAFPQWRQKLFIGALKDKELIVLSVKGNTVTEDGRLLQERGQRIRDVRVGPDGYLYVLTDESDGELLKVSP